MKLILFWRRVANREFDYSYWELQERKSDAGRLCRNDLRCKALYLLLLASVSLSRSVLTPTLSLSLSLDRILSCDFGCRFSYELTISWREEEVAEGRTNKTEKREGRTSAPISSIMNNAGRSQTFYRGSSLLALETCCFDCEQVNAFWKF